MVIGERARTRKPLRGSPLCEAVNIAKLSKYTETYTPDQLHMISGSVYRPGVRKQSAETVRNFAGSGGMLSPALQEVEDPEVGLAAAPNYQGGGYIARQRTALLYLLKDATASALDGRKAAFIAMATGGIAL